MTIDVDDVATDADLETYTLGRSNLQDLLPEEWRANPALPASESNLKLATIARQRALDVVLQSLRKRRPPIEDYDLVDVTELREVVCLGALEILYRGAMRHEDSPNEQRAKTYEKLFRSELAALQPSVRAGATTSSLTIRMSRG